MSHGSKGQEYFFFLHKMIMAFMINLSPKLVLAPLVGFVRICGLENVWNLRIRLALSYIYRINVRTERERPGEWHYITF